MPDLAGSRGNGLAGPTVMVAAPHRLLVGAIRRAFTEAPHGMAVVADAVTWDETTAVLRSARPDVVLLDLEMPGCDPAGWVAALRDESPGVRVVVLAADHHPSPIDAALRAGAVGCIVKSVDPRDFPSAVRQAVLGALITAPSSSPQPDALPDADAELTSRERAILAAVSSGLSNREIGDQLWVSEQTVKFHLNNLYRKLGVANRTAAARFAYDNDLTGELP